MINDKDKVMLVDENNKYIAKMDKYEAHKHPAKLHQAVSVWLINDKNQVLMQRRSAHKIVGAGWWANAICGNVRPSEIYSACALRRLKEEIGIENVQLKPVYKFKYKAYCNETYGEYEFDQVYVGKFNGEPVLNQDEVTETVWISLEELVKNITINAACVSPDQTLLMGLKDLKEYTSPSGIIISGRKQLLAPWTCMMLKDARLTQALRDLATKHKPNSISVPKK